MTKTDIARRLQDRYQDMPRNRIEDVIRQVFGLMTESLQAGEGVIITGFGSFETVDRVGRTVKSFGKGEYEVPAHRAVRFKAGKNLKAAVNNEQ